MAMTSPSKTARPRAAGTAPVASSSRSTPAPRDESPLDWLARRTDKAGHPLVDATQHLAGDRLRADFTHAQLMPSVTSRWDASGVRGGGHDAFSDLVLAAKLRVSKALTAVGPELSGVLVDVCCFLKGLEQVERERGWPARTAKVVLGLGLDRLARHYGLQKSLEGRGRAPLRAWHAPEPPEAAPPDG